MPRFSGAELETTPGETQGDEPSLPDRSSPSGGEGVGLFYRFVGLAAIAAGSILLLAGLGLQAILRRATIEHARDDAAQATLALRDVEMDDLLAALRQGDESRRTDSAGVRDDIRRRFQPFLEAFDIKAVRIFDADGRQLFSLTPGAVDLSPLHAPLLARAMRGEMATSLADAAEGEGTERVTETYIPVPDAHAAGGADRPAAGVLMIRQSAAKEFESSRLVLMRAVLVLASVLLVVFAVLSLLMYRAQQAIRARAHELAEERARTREQAALRALEERLHAAERLASIGALAAGVGHDLNNLLLPMRGQIRSLEAGDLPEQARQQVRAVRETVEFLRQLGDNLRLLAGGGDASPRDAVTDVSAWWRQVGAMLVRALPKDARFKAEVPERLPPVRVAPPRLTQAVLNLLVNAGDALEPGVGGEVRLWAEAAADGLSVSIGVADHGRGMSSEVARRAFDPFFTTKRRGASTGLGLALVQGVVTSAGGSIQLSTEPGRGTTLIMRLPVAMETPRVAVASDPGGSPPLASVSIEDDRVGAYACAVLREAGFHVSRTAAADPGIGVLWVTEPDERALGAARIFLRGDPRRRVIVIGDASPAWEATGAVILGDVLDQESLQRALGVAGLAPAGEAA